MPSVLRSALSPPFFLPRHCHKVRRKDERSIVLCLACCQNLKGDLVHDISEHRWHVKMLTAHFQKLSWGSQCVCPDQCVHMSVHVFCHASCLALLLSVYCSCARNQVDGLSRSSHWLGECKAACRQPMPQLQLPSSTQPAQPKPARSPTTHHGALWHTSPLWQPLVHNYRTIRVQL